MKTADALGTPLDSSGVIEVLPTVYSYATPTLITGHSYWVVDLREERPKSNTLTIFQYLPHLWEEQTKEEAREQGWPKGRLVHSLIDGCFLSENFHSPPIWSYEEKEHFKPWELFSQVRTFFRDDGTWLFKILQIHYGIPVRITYPSEQQQVCHEEALRVIRTNASSFVEETPEP